MNSLSKESSNEFFNSHNINKSEYNGMEETLHSRKIKEDDNESNDEKICRICHGGTSEGRMISPCVCKGSMRYVHRYCLDRWRSTSINPKSFFECDQCKFRYHFHRTNLARIIGAWYTVHTITIIIFTLLTIFSGFISKLLLSDITEEPPEFWSLDFTHIIYGLAFEGLIGFFSLALTLHPPLGPMFFGGGGGGGGGGDAARAISLIVFVVVIFLGLIRFIYNLYQIVRKINSKLLTRFQDLVENIS